MPFTDDELEKIFTFETLDVAQRERSRTVFAGARDFARLLNDVLPESREKSLAITTLQQSMLWADAAIAIHGWDRYRTSPKG